MEGAPPVSLEFVMTERGGTRERHIGGDIGEVGAVANMALDQNQLGRLTE